MKRAYSQYEYNSNDYIDYWYGINAAIVFERDMMKAGDNRLVAWNKAHNVEASDKTYFSSYQQAFQRTLFQMTEYWAKNGMCDHVFFKDPYMHNWLLQCRAPFQEDFPYEVVGYKAPRQTYLRDHYIFMLHFGSKIQPYLVGVTTQNAPISRIIPQQQAFFCVGRGRNSEYSVMQTCYKNEDEILSGKHRSLDYDESNPDAVECNNEFSVICSAIAYMQCFPDAVKNGIPDDLKHQNYYRNQPCKSVELHRSLVIREGPCPHYRVGHFRLLSSEKFVHKKGQIVFVHGTFVKGRALTVEEPK